ncbi:hypothetical protein B5V03_04185 [Bradyrhizobium betae]|uniref:Uncharacterized protein n=2 Tax=Bradyrhizobium betae TaxID=244734 RepID=A0A4Q1VLW5_9BRAD|nr:hypothetical protein B5V03_04185 [Bradyrhizobium betae]
MGGILDEFNMFRSCQPQACLLPPGFNWWRRTRNPKKKPQLQSDVGGNLDYVGLFHDRLQVSVRELRYQKRDLQPVDTYARMWIGSEPVAHVGSGKIEHDKATLYEDEEIADTMTLKISRAKSSRSRSPNRR